MSRGGATNGLLSTAAPRIRRHRLPITVPTGGSGATYSKATHASVGSNCAALTRVRKRVRGFAMRAGGVRARLLLHSVQSASCVRRILLDWGFVSQSDGCGAALYTSTPLTSNAGTYACKKACKAPGPRLLVCYRPLAISSASRGQQVLMRSSGGDLGLSRTLLARAGPCRGAAPHCSLSDSP